MASFCKECSIVTFDEDFGDMAHIADAAAVLCEGCGPTVVNRDGECINEGCDASDHSSHRHPLSRRYLRVLAEADARRRGPWGPIYRLKDAAVGSRHGPGWAYDLRYWWYCWVSPCLSCKKRGCDGLCAWTKV